jgi:hypothetical protein
MELIAAGIDPGPPATWDAQAIARRTPKRPKRRG